MSQENRRFAIAALSLTGTIIGVGIFGVPYALSKSGAAIGLAYFLLLGGIQLLQHLFYAEAAIATEEPLRLAGLVGKYLGKGSRRIAALSLVCGYWGGMLAYMLVGGSFLHTLLNPWFGGGLFAYQVGWALAGAALVYFGLELIAKIDTAASVGLIVALLAILVAGLRSFDAANIVWAPGSDLFLPYGVILFSLSGLPAVLEMEDILKGEHAKYRAAVVWGTLAAVLLTAGFGYLVWGVTGTATTQDDAGALRAALGPAIGVIIAVFGFLAVATSFFATAINLQNMFEHDYGTGHFRAWFLTGSVPLAALFLGAKDFVPVVSFTGAVFGGITAVLVARLYVAVAQGGSVKEKRLNAPLWLAYASMIILAVGAAYQVLDTATRLW